MQPTPNFSRLCIATAALSSLLLALGCSSKSDSESDQVFTPSPNAPTGALGAAGSTFIAPLMGKWVSRYHQSHPKIQINYRPIGATESWQHRRGDQRL